MGGGRVYEDDRESCKEVAPLEGLGDKGSEEHAERDWKGEGIRREYNIDVEALSHFADDDDDDDDDDDNDDDDDDNDDDDDERFCCSSF